ncbi:MAG: ABC transporter ATP-binding protein [Oligoflexia bacterium]
MLEISHVSQAFRSGFWLKLVPVLHDVSLTVPKGSITGFLGPNGAGKTTLIHLIMSIRRPRAGRLTLAGMDVSKPEARLKMGYLPERPYFYEHLTGEQLLYFFGRLSGLPDGEIASRIPAVLDRVGMSHARNKELRAYSKGMLQRIGIAQAILGDPEFLVLDEPMSGLDPFGRKEIRELITDLGAEGRTIFFSSHIIPDVESICDRVALIQKGRLIGSGPIRKLLGRDAQSIEVAFFGLDEASAKGVAPQGWIRLQKTPDGLWRGYLEKADQVNPTAQKILSTGGALVEITPQRPSLEEWFTRA